MTIHMFRGRTEFLSNFLILDKATQKRLWGYPSVENYYQAMKTLDMDLRAEFKRCTPGQAKRMGRKLDIREDWDDIKDDVMMMGLQVKFALGTPIAQLLTDTFPHDLIEGNWWHDNYWGDCNCGKFPACTIPGENKLGTMLMMVRDDLILTQVEMEF